MRQRALCANLKAMTANQFGISAEGEELHKSRSPAVRSACDAFIFSVFRYRALQLTVFHGVGISGEYFTVRFTVKKFRLGARG